MNIREKHTAMSTKKRVLSYGGTAIFYNMKSGKYFIEKYSEEFDRLAEIYTFIDEVNKYYKEA